MFILVDITMRSLCPSSYSFSLETSYYLHKEALLVIFKSLLVIIESGPFAEILKKTIPLHITFLINNTSYEETLLPYFLNTLFTNCIINRNGGLYTRTFHMVRHSQQSRRTSCLATRFGHRGESGQDMGKPFATHREW